MTGVQTCALPIWYVYACAKAGIVLGDDKNNANPKTAAKRKDAAAMVVRAFA